MSIGNKWKYGDKKSNFSFQKRFLKEIADCCDIQFNPPTPPEDPIYLYALSVVSFNFSFDYYNGVTVDGTFYNPFGSVVMNDQYGGAVNIAFDADMTAAGLVNASNGTRANGFTLDPGVYGDQFVFLAVTDQPHTIVVNLTIGGVTADYTLHGGLYTYKQYCCTITTPDPNFEDVLLQDWRIVDTSGTAVNSGITYPVGILVTDPTSIQVLIDQYLNTNNSLLNYGVTYTDNLDGTVTLKMQIPIVDCDPPNGINAILLSKLFTTSGQFSVDPC